MGFFDFGDKAMIKTIAKRLKIGITQLANELDSSHGIATPLARGLASKSLVPIQFRCIPTRELSITHIPEPNRK